MKNTISNIIESYMKSINKGVDNSVINIDLFPPFSHIDQIDLGDLVTIAGRPCNGRTELVISLLDELTIKKHISTALFCLNLKESDFRQRLLIKVSDIPYYKLKTIESLSASECNSLKEAISKTTSSPLYFNGFSSICIEDISTKIIELVEKQGIKMVVITGVQLIETNEYFTDYRYAYSKVAKTLKSLAKNLNIAIIVTSSINWSMEEREGMDGKHPHLMDLREVGDWDEYSDIVIGVFRPESYGILCNEKGQDMRNIIIVDILKNKENRIVEPIYMEWDSKTLSIKDKYLNKDFS